MYNSRESFVSRNCREHIFNDNGEYVGTVLSEHFPSSSCLYSDKRREQDEKDMSLDPWD